MEGIRSSVHLGLLLDLWAVGTSLHVSRIRPLYWNEDREREPHTQGSKVCMYVTFLQVISHTKRHPCS